MIPEGDPLSEKGVIQIEDLEEIPLFCSEQAWNGDLKKWFGSSFSKMKLEGSFRLSYNGSIFAREGLGYLLTFRHLIDTSKESGLIFRPLEPALETTLYIAWNRYQTFTSIAETEYLKPEDRAGHPEAANIHYADCLKSSPKRAKKASPKAVSSNQEYLTVDEAALLAGVEHGRILKWIRKNRFPVVRSGKKLIRIPRTAFEDFLLKTHETEE